MHAEALLPRKCLSIAADREQTGLFSSLAFVHLGLRLLFSFTVITALSHPAGCSQSYSLPCPSGKERHRVTEWVCGTQPGSTRYKHAAHLSLTTFLCTVQITWNSHQGLRNYNFSQFITICSLHYGVNKKNSLQFPL